MKPLYDEFAVGDSIYYHNGSWGMNGKVVKVYPSGWVGVVLDRITFKVVKQSSLKKC